MGLISVIARALFARGAAAELGRVGIDLAGAFRPNATRQLELGHEAYSAAQAAYAAEFQRAGQGWFDALVNGLNRLPRPLLALSAPGLFAYAMVDPEGFALRMRGLQAVPEPRWWLLGAVVAFYFGARETHYLRSGRGPEPVARPLPPSTDEAVRPETNPALAEWLAGGGDNVERE